MITVTFNDPFSRLIAKYTGPGPSSTFTTKPKPILLGWTGKPTESLPGHAPHDPSSPAGHFGIRHANRSTIARPLLAGVCEAKEASNT